MTDYPSILLLAGVIKSFFLFLPSSLTPENEFEEWLNDDGFSKDTLKDGSKKFLFIELDSLKSKFRSDLLDVTQLKDDNGNTLSPLGVYNLIQGHKNRISKVRLMILNEVSIAYNLHKPSGVTYVVGRSYWIDNNGKKVRKFAKNFGSEEKVLVKGEIPKSMMVEIKQEIARMMWELYQTEYKGK